MRVSPLLLLCLASTVHAGSVLNYGWPDEPDSAALKLEIQNGKVRWQWREEDWTVFDRATDTITEYIGDAKYGDNSHTFTVYSAKDAVATTVPEELGDTERAGVDCTMYAFEESGERQKVCLASAPTVGLAKDDYVTLLALYSALHRLRDQDQSMGGFPLGFHKLEEVAVWQSDKLRLLRMEPIAIPKERFETPPGYKEYAAPKDLGW